jgi:hypothetical protein
MLVDRKTGLWGSYMPGQRAFALLDRQPAQIFAVEFERVEGAERSGTLTLMFVVKRKNDANQQVPTCCVSPGEKNEACLIECSAQSGKWSA